MSSFPDGLFKNAAAADVLTNLSMSRSTAILYCCCYCCWALMLSVGFVVVAPLAELVACRDLLKALLI